MASARNSHKDKLVTFATVALLVAAGFWLAYQFVEPAPPENISISTGSEEGAYYAFAQEYKVLLEQQGISLEILPSAGSTENLQRLVDDDVDVAFVQGGITHSDSTALSLGSLYYEPVWLFYRQGLSLKNIPDLAGLKIAIGPEGSGTRQLASTLLADNKLLDGNNQLSDKSGSDAAKGLLDGTIDAAFFIASVESAVIQQLINNPTVKVLSLQRAEAYRRIHPFLTKITLPEGIIDLQKNIPAQDITLIAPTANLLIKEDLHPALTFLLLQAIHNTHKKAGLFASTNFFPNGNNVAAPISDVADRFYKKGPPFLMRYLPFWTAVMIDRFVVMLIPLIALLIPLSKLIPPLYEWRISSRIYRWYEALHLVDDKLHNGELSEPQREELNAELDHIVNEVNKVKAPLSHARQVYHLLSHIELIRNKLLR